MDLDRELRSLAEADNWDGPVVSVYLDTRWADEMQRERVRVFWGNARDKARADGVPESALRSIDREIETLIRRAAPGQAVAIFSSPTRFRVLGLPCEVGQFARWDERPALMPMARAISRCERALVAVTGSKRSRLYEFYGTELRSRVEIERNDFPGRHDRGGYSQKNFGRHIREHMRWELDAVVRALVEAFDREPCKVFVAGTTQTAGMFLDRLPQRVVQNAIMLGAFPSDPNREIPDVIERVNRWQEEHRNQDVLALEGRVYHEAMGSRQGALGAKNVILALQEGRVHELILRDNFECYGATCRVCGAIDVRPATQCNYCGGEVRLGNLVEPIIQRALREGAHVRFVPDGPRHQGMGGIAALLRPHRGAGAPTLGNEQRLEDFTVGRGA